MQVGKFIQVRASRRLPKESGSNPFVYSVAVKGPVTVDDETARGMLEIFTRVRCAFAELLFRTFPVCLVCCANFPNKFCSV